ncbi:MAG TPA: carbonic anhydrase [Terriglobales bacterium]|nr:carbonic anhydrase [Terriglobales bacterium]
MPKWMMTIVLLMNLVPFSVAQESANHPAHVRNPDEQNPAENIWTALMAGNHRFVTGETSPREFTPLRHKLATGQQPRVVVLTCSDSRVPPELIFDQSLGDLFVIRTAGNIADAVGLGSIEYAVEHLGSSVLVVLGHEKCGAVTAACSGGKMPTANLQAIVDKVSPAVLKAKQYATSDELLNAAIRENVDQSAKDILANSEVLRQALKEGKLTIFEAIYKLDSGEVERVGKLPLPD